LYFITQKAS